MKRTRTILIAIIAAIAIILLAVLVIFIPSRAGQASDPTLTPQAPRVTPTAFIAKTNTRAPTATTPPTATPTAVPTLAPTIAPTNTYTPTATATPTTIPTLPIPPAPAVSQATSTQGPPLSVGFTLRYMTTSTYVGGTAQFTISTAPGAACDITVYDPRGIIFQAAGLEAKKAGVDGMCTWIWVVPPTDNKGTGYIKIDANGMTQTFVYTLQ